MGLKKAVYEGELLRLQTELIKLQEWVRAEGARLVVVFEGRDAAGKGGTIKRVAEHRLFLRQCPVSGYMLVEDGILLRKYWFGVGGPATAATCLAGSAAAPTFRTSSCTNVPKTKRLNGRSTARKPDPS